MSDHVASVQQQKDGRVFVITFSKTTDGHRIMDGLPLVVENAEDALTLGDAVVAGLQRSTDGVLPARDLRRYPPDAGFLDWLGVPTYAAYARGVRSVSVWAAGGAGDLRRVEVTAEANGGPSRGFAPTDEGEVLTYEGSERLGMAVQRALAKATP
ncbi:hypothetical protein AB0N73_09175 [Microbacterium sp. NPDC089189]|uniref:hypothetical protein n=1 Tax=Microbacterium sp. NPDC089189 TaxID=3154972 RepID=UPI0034153F08